MPQVNEFSWFLEFFKFNFLVVFLILSMNFLIFSEFYLLNKNFKKLNLFFIFV